jgi:hypothetical protein
VPERSITHNRSRGQYGTFGSQYGRPNQGMTQGGSCNRTRPLPTVPPKREYSGVCPETSADWRSPIANLGVWGRSRTRERPAFPAHSRFAREAWRSAVVAGWRRSADRTCLHANSLQTGNLTGKSVILGAKRHLRTRKISAVQRLNGHFSASVNRENLSMIRECSPHNREDANTDHRRCPSDARDCSRPWLALLALCAMALSPTS